MRESASESPQETGRSRKGSLPHLDNRVLTIEGAAATEHCGPTFIWRQLAIAKDLFLLGRENLYCIAEK
jgi:hypothetical protein